MPAEYSKNPVNMNRKQWEKEKSWNDFIDSDMKYCRGVAGDYEHFLYLLGELGYEVKQGVHLAVKAEKMRRFRRLDTINEEYTKENLEEFFAKGSYAYESPRVLTPNVKYLTKPKNDYQQKFYAKIHRMRVVEKCRFQYKSARFKEDLERMHMLQEEYLFLCKKDIKSSVDIVTKIGLAKFDIQRLSEKQRNLYKERAEQKRKSVSENNFVHFISTESEYRNQLDDIKLEKKKLQSEISIGERCLNETLYVGLLVPEDIEIGNVYDVKVPEKPWYLKKEERKGAEEIREEKAFTILDEEMKATFELDSFDMEVESDGINLAYNESTDTVGEIKVLEVANISTIEENETILYEDNMPQLKAVTKESYKSMTDKEKAEWIGIDGNDVYGSMKRFHEKIHSIGIVYQYSSDETEEFCRLEEANRKDAGTNWNYRNQDKRR